MNPIHQYLQALALKTARQRMIEVLRRWLLSANGCTDGKPIARNFAAYVLGMLNAIEAQDDLASVLYNETGDDVQIYAILPLGRMRARVQLPVLVDLFNRTDGSQARLLVAQAVSRMVGIADYSFSGGRTCMNFTVPLRHR